MKICLICTPRPALDPKQIAAIYQAWWAAHADTPTSLDDLCDCVTSLMPAPGADPTAIADYCARLIGWDVGGFRMAGHRRLGTDTIDRYSVELDPGDTNRTPAGVLAAWWKRYGNAAVSPRDVSGTVLAYITPVSRSNLEQFFQGLVGAKFGPLVMASIPSTQPHQPVRFHLDRGAHAGPAGSVTSAPVAGH